MKRNYWIMLLAAALLLTACGGTSQPEALPTVVLESSTGGTNAPTTTSGGTVVASAEIRPAEAVDLSFPLLGAVKTVEVEVGDTVAAGDQLVVLDTTILEARVAEAEAGVATAETQVRYLQRVGVGTAYEQIDAAKADVDRAQAVVDQLKAQLEQATLKTPISGTVVKVDVAPGETVNPGQVILVIADLSHMRVETTDLSERDIPAVQIGGSTSISIDALDESFDGKVVDIDRQSETVGGDVTYRVTIEFDQQPAGLRWGMSAEVQIHSED
jgi:HlyD family secretion protein